MIFEKEKLRRAAEKNLAQGKIKAAIKDYCQLAESDPRDFNTLNMLGDLYVRVGAKDSAIECFTRIAEHYDEQGFNQKAIAMYKKIARLKPDDITISARLAPIYQALGLIAEARTHFLTVAEDYQKKGERLAALEIWQQIADLDPNDTKTKLNLAQSFIRENQSEKAVELFTEAGQRLLAKNNFEEASNAFSQALEIDQSYLPALSGATDAHIKLGFPDEAIEKLGKVRENLHEEAEFYALLSRCYLELENALAAEEVTNFLIEKDPLSYGKILDVTKLYIKTGDLESAVRTLELYAEAFLAGGKEAELEHWINEILTRDPEHGKTLRALARLRGWQRNELELKEALERLAESARLGESVEEERDALSELRMLFPSENRYLTRLQELGFEIAPQIENQESDFKEEENTFVPAFETFGAVGEHGTSGDFQDYSSDDDSFEVPVEYVQTAENDNYDEFETFPMEPVQFENPVVGNSEFQVVETQQPEINSPSYENLLNQELDSIDFYVSQGFNELALDSLDMLEKQFGFHPQIQARRQKLQSQSQTEINAETATVPLENTKQTVVNETTVETLNFDERVVSVNPSFADIFEEFGEDLEVAAIPNTQTDDYETHYNLGLAYKEMGLFDDAVEEFQAAAKVATPGDGTSRYLQCCNLIGHCFIEKGMPGLAVRWYERGLAAPGHSEEEYQALRYELGTAYEKNGEFDKALAQFTEIYAFDVAYRGVGEKLRSLQRT